MPFVEDTFDTLPLRLPSYTPAANPLRPSFSETVSAASPKDNPTVNVFRSQLEQTFPPDPDGHDPLDEIGNTKYAARYLDRFIESRSTRETRTVIHRIENEEQADICVSLPYPVFISAMSMHEYEDTVEATVRVLDSVEGLDHRTLYWNLYDFQSWWDTGITYFRVAEILVKRRLLYPFSIQDHPEHPKYEAALSKFESEKYETILRNPNREWAEDNRVVGYWAKPYMYCVAGSEFWKAFVDKGALMGADAVAPPKMDIVDLAEVVVHEAEKQGNRDVLSMWYPLIFGELEVGNSSRKKEDARKDQAVRRIFETFVRTRAYEEDFDYGNWRHPPPDILDEMEGEEREFMLEWFGPSWKHKGLEIPSK